MAQDTLFPKAKNRSVVSGRCMKLHPSSWDAQRAVCCRVTCANALSLGARVQPAQGSWVINVNAC